MSRLNAPYFQKVAIAIHLMMAISILFGFWYLDLHPVDDLMRHVVSYSWDYSHTKMFPLANLPEYNLYPGFEFLTGLITRATNPDHAVTIVSLSCMAMMMVSTYVTCNYWGQKHGASVADVLLVCTVYLAAMTISRASFGRPESWCLVWAIWATTLTNDRPVRTFMMILGGLLTSVSYWLAPVLFPLVLVADATWKKRLTVLCGLSAFHLVFWAIWSNGDILHWGEMLNLWAQNRTTMINETLPVAVLLLNGYAKLMTLLVVLGFIATYLHIRGTFSDSKTTSLQILQDSEVKKFFTSIAVLVAYLMTNMMRIVSTAFAATLQICVKGVARIKLPAVVSIAISLTIYSFWVQTIYKERGYYTRGPVFQVPNGSRVLTPFGNSTFSMINSNPGKLEMLPAMEVGASIKEVATLTAKLGSKSYGPISCEELQAVKVTHIVDHGTFVGGLLPCMSVIDIDDKGWALLGVQAKQQEIPDSKQ